VPFSERVGSKTFDGNVQRFDGEFVGAVDSLLGVNAAGPTLGTAEDRLETLVDFFA
jgi:predicted RNase H-like HicB family nuclease